MDPNKNEEPHAQIRGSVGVAFVAEKQLSIAEYIEARAEDQQEEETEKESQACGVAAAAISSMNMVRLRKPRQTLLAKLRRRIQLEHPVLPNPSRGRRIRCGGSLRLLGGIVGSRHTNVSVICDRLPVGSGNRSSRLFSGFCRDTDFWRRA